MTPPLPVVRAADIQSGLFTKSHFLNPGAARTTVSISDLAPAGDMGNCPLYMNILEAGGESTVSLRADEV